MVETIETVIIGAGQAGLSTSYFLKEKGREHVILEKASGPGDTWRSRRWDSFSFVTPNWTFQLPGGEYDGADPDGFMLREEICARFKRYAESNRLPVSYNTAVEWVAPEDGRGFRVRTADREYLARNVVAANGWLYRSKVPAFAAKLPASITQIPSHAYRNPQALPDGAVLVVGSAQSGTQVADELNQGGRKVYLATGVSLHSPRYYRGRDVFDWFVDSGQLDVTLEQLAAGAKLFPPPMLTGKDGGRGLNLHQLCREGVVLLGHARDYADGKLVIAPDLQENLRKADGAQKSILQFIDEYIQQRWIDAPADPFAAPADAYGVPERESLDLTAEGIQTIIWACGYQYDATIFPMPVLNPKGRPDAAGTASRNYPGLYFVGMPFQPGPSSTLTLGVAKPAAEAAEAITSRRASG